MSKKTQKPSITQQLKPVIRFVGAYRRFLFSMLILVLVTFMVFRINQLATLEPSDSAVEEKLQSVTRPKIDQAALDQIQKLQDQNVEVKSLFDDARRNPFSE